MEGGGGTKCQDPQSARKTTPHHRRVITMQTHGRCSKQNATNAAWMPTASQDIYQTPQNATDHICS